MSVVKVILGDRSLVSINGSDFRHTRSDMEIVQGEHDTNDSSSGDFDDAQLGRGRLNVANLSCYRHAGASVHGGPFLIRRKQEIDLKMWDYEGANPYHSPTFLVTRIQITRDAKTGEPIMVSLSGRSSGIFYTPDET